jgi:hypothetical protein
MTFTFTIPDELNVETLNANSVTAEVPAFGTYSLNHLTFVASPLFIGQSGPTNSMWGPANQ